MRNDPSTRLRHGLPDNIPMFVHAAEDEDGKGFLGRANDMFDSVWYPLPAWVRILLVIAVSAIVGLGAKSFRPFPCAISSSNRFDYI